MATRQRLLPGQPLVVLCRELSEAETAACAELVPQHGLRLVHLQAGELDRDPALAREQLRRLLNVESQPAPTGAGSRAPPPAYRRPGPALAAAPTATVVELCRRASLTSGGPLVEAAYAPTALPSPAAARSSCALSVRSQVKSASSRPKWP